MSDFAQDYSRPGAAPTVSIADVLRGIAGRWLLVTIFTLMGVGLGLAIVTLIKPSYTTEAIVLIENMETPYSRANDNIEYRPGIVDDRIVQTQISVLKSHDMGLRVIDALKLKERAEFDSLRKGMGRLQTFLIAIGFGDDPRLKTAEQRALSRYLGQLTVYQVEGSNAAVIKYSARDPQTAAEVPNTLAENYVASTRETQSEPTGRAREWLARQIEDLRKKVSASEQAVEEFRSSAGLLQGAATTTLGAQEISELNTQITVAEAARTEARARADSIRRLLASKGSVDTASDVLNSALIQRLREQQVSSVRRVAELATTYLPNHPKMVAAQNDLTNVDRQIRGEALKIVDGLEEQANIAAAREESLRSSLEELKSRETTANLDEVKLKALERDAAADRALLESLLNRYADASARQEVSAQPGMARIIQQAGVPTSPSFPKIGPTVGLTSIAGLALGLGLAFLFEIMSAAQSLNRLPMAAAMPKPQLPTVVYEPPPPAPVQHAAVAPPVRPAAPPQSPPPQRPAAYAHQPAGVADAVLPVAVMPSIASEAAAGPAIYSAEVSAAANRLFTWFNAAQKSYGAKVIGITSLGGSFADAAVVTTALVRTTSNTGKRTIVVDAASSGSCLERLFGLPVGPGLVDLVSGSADFTRVISRDTASGCHLLRWGMDRSAHAQHVAESNLQYVLQAFSGVYDLTVMHCGEASSRAPELLTKCDAVLLLSPGHRKRDAAIAVNMLQSSGVKLVQVVRLDPPALPRAANG
ncbi:MAG: exopolysaccharide transport family protein [Aestuariivirga sp.]